MNNSIRYCYLFLLSVVFLMLIIPNILFAGEALMLDNGISILKVKRDFTKTVSLTIFIKGGIFRENSNDNGIGDLFSSVWLKSSDLLKDVEFYGGSISSGSSYDYFEFSVSMVSSDFIKIKNELEKIINNPNFNESIFNNEKDILLKNIKRQKDDPNSVASEGFNRSTYGSFKYSMSPSGTVESVSNIKFNDMKNYYKQIFQGANIIVSISGNIDSSIEDMVSSVFSKVNKGNAFKIECSSSAITADKVTEEEDGRIKQSKMFIAYTAPSANQTEYIPLKILTDVLGGGMSSKYFNLLRKEKGYAYSVGAYYPSKLCSSRFVGYIGLEYKNVNDAVKYIEKINKNLKENITIEDVEFAKNYTLGKILSESQTNSKISWYNAFFYNLGLGVNFLDKYLESIKNISYSDVINSGKIFDSPKTLYVLKPKKTDTK